MDSVVRAMRRPFVLGTERPAARNVILLCGGAGTGRHFALAETARIMAALGALLQSDKNRGGGPCPLPQFRCGKAAFCRICMRPCTPPGRS